MYNHKPGTLGIYGLGGGDNDGENDLRLVIDYIFRPFRLRFSTRIKASSCPGIMRQSVPAFAFGLLERPGNRVQSF